MKKLFLLLPVLLFLGCSISKKVVDSSSETVIAFGSCNKTYLPQPLWKPIISNEPDMWIWLGDIVYADTNDPAHIRKLYETQNANEDYKNLKSICPITGVWDDHDYGVNDGDKNFEIKKKSRELLFDFLDMHTDAPERKRTGGYTSHLIGEPGKQVKIILLDCRYFRDELTDDPTGKQRYLPNETGDILGEAQWTWLEKELTESSAQVHIIGSGVQVISEEHRYEKWANFPTAHQRLYDLLEKTNPARPVIISGDRHIAEISKIKLSGLAQPLFDITSSGLTHSYEKILEKGEFNSHRSGEKLTGEKNFGIFRINWSKNSVEVKAEIRGLENRLIFDERIF